MMFKGASIVWTAIFSKLLLKMVLEKKHIMGCSLAVIGVIVVGLSNFSESFPESNEVYSD